MQNILIGYVARLHELGAGDSVSIADAVETHLAACSPYALNKLREAAADLNRICELELGRRDEPSSPCNCDACLNGDGH